MELDTSTLTFAIIVAASVLWKKRRENEASKSSPEVCRLWRLISTNKLTHPYLRAEYFQRKSNNITEAVEEEDCVANFTDLASAIAACCGVTVDDDNERRREIIRDIGPDTRHIIVVLCDGMGNSILEQHLPESSFLRRHNQCNRLRAVFPSTTPAALTSLATAQWPGQHGMPGWDLREQPGCDYPGHDSGGPIVQLRILAPRIMNMRNHEPANYNSFDDVFRARPWSQSLMAERKEEESKRRMMFINAYNGDDFPTWYQGKSDESPTPTDFSAWQTGHGNESDDSETLPSLLDTATIRETSFDTLGKPEGSSAALEYFRDGIDKALRSIAKAEASSHRTFTYLYTAHPDKHMHALGTNHPEVSTLVQGMNDELEEMWNKLGNRAGLLSKYGILKVDETDSCAKTRVDTTVVVTADHGHVSVFPSDMVVLPDNIIECLEYANIGVHGKGTSKERKVTIRDA